MPHDHNEFKMMLNTRIILICLSITRGKDICKQNHVVTLANFRLRDRLHQHNINKHHVV